ncbi:MAG TPA: hypothetical protein VLB67_06400 [Acidimicrobiia bacterium]|nr:hypothetical protein [Acidimicrobiia bacterium]
MILRQSERIRPEHAAVWLTLACLGAFWLSTFVPRADGSLLGSDGTHYFSYLPSVILDGDLDFTNDYEILLAGEPEKRDEYLNALTPTGRPANVWSIGPAILWSPFYIGAHAVMLVLSALNYPVSADGYGYPYQLAALTASVLYGGLGLILIQRAVGHVVENRRSVAVALVLVTAGGNLIYYMTIEPHMSHAVSVLGVGMLSALWLPNRTGSGPPHAAKLGVVAGVMALVRPQDGLFLALPYLDRLLQERGTMTPRRLAVLARDGAISAVAAMIVFIPQLVVWQRLWGSVASPYSHRGEEFYWLDPALFEVMLSMRRGLVVWHPVFLFALAGLGILYRRDRALALSASAGFLLQWYLIASWWAWEQGKSFGGRMFIVCTPLFVIGLAALWDRVHQEGRTRQALWVGGTLVVANLVFIPLYVLSW